MRQLSFLLIIRGRDLSRPSIILRNLTAVGYFRNENCWKCISNATRRVSRAALICPSIPGGRGWLITWYGVKIFPREWASLSAIDQAATDRSPRCHPDCAFPRWCVVVVVVDTSGKSVRLWNDPPPTCSEVSHKRYLVIDTVIKIDCHSEKKKIYRLFHKIK